MTSWTEAQQGYPAWEIRHDPDLRKWVAVAVRLSLRKGSGANFAKVAKKWVKQLDALGTADGNTIVIPRHETDRLQAELALPDSKSVLLMFFVRRTWLGKDRFPPAPDLTIGYLAIGAPFVTPAGFLQDGSQKPIVGVGDLPAGPVVGIIDDGIAFLNARFCMGAAPRKTRFLAIWLQSEIFQPTLGPRDVPIGIGLRREEIDAYLASGRAETAIYREINDDIYKMPSQQATNTRLAHGTHVLDLAAGEAPETGGGALIAVQLAPGMAEDTSGRRLESFLVMGLRWMVNEVRGLDRDFVVNISLGSLAGPGDDTNFIAQALVAEIKAFERLSPGHKMRIVVAYGNSWRSNLVGKVRLDGGDPRRVDWRIQPDGYSPSFVELRMPKRKGPAKIPVKLRLAPPDPGMPPVVLDLSSLTREQILWHDTSGRPIAAVFPLVDESDAYAFLLAVAPTASLRAGTDVLAPAGAWSMTFELDQSEGICPVTLRVQRNDTPVGYRVYGRQSYLADSRLGGWDDETRDFTMPEAAITRKGTANAYAGVPDIVGDDTGATNGIYFIGAVRPDLRQPDYREAFYTSEGWVETPDIDALDIKSTGPTFAVQADAGAFWPGRRAASVNSGLRQVRLSGTSVAAGLATRWVAETLSQANPPPLPPLVHGPTNGNRNTRLGFGVMVTDDDLS